MEDFKKFLRQEYDKIAASFYWEGTQGPEDCEEEREQFVWDVIKHLPPQSSTNSIGQPIGDFPTGIPSEDDFNQFHETPQCYGEEAEWIAVSKKFSPEEALKMIQELLKDEWGWSDGPDGDGAFPKSTDDLISLDIGWGYDHDSYHYSDGGYWICSESNNVSKRWEAWGIETQ